MHSSLSSCIMWSNLLQKILEHSTFPNSFYPVDTHSELTEAAQRALDGSKVS
jgi:hypothetical protein